LDWGSELVLPGEGVAFPVERAQGWEATIRNVTFYLHAFRSPVTVRRFAHGARANVRLRGVEADHIVETRFVQDTSEAAPAAVGVEMDVDGLRVGLQLPAPRELEARAAAADALPAWRSAYLRDRILDDPTLSALANPFQRDWLYQVYLSALLVPTYLDPQLTLQAASDQLHGSDASDSFRNVLDAIFQAGGSGYERENGTTPTVAAPEVISARLRDRLADLLGQSTVLERLRQLGRELWQPSPRTWHEWLRARAHESLAESILFACQQLAAEQAAADSLLLDLQRVPGIAVADDGSAEIWITESTLGGAGVVEAIAHAFAADPRAFFKGLEAAVAPSDLELTSTHLDHVLELATMDSEVSAQVAEVRRQTDHGPRGVAQAQLFRLLALRGLGVDHALSSALNHRLLRSGTDARLDHVLLDVVRAWRAAESRLGVAIEVRVFAYLASRDRTLGPRLRDALKVAVGVTPGTDQLVGVLAGLLWPRPAEMRARFFESYSPFRTHGYSDPTLVRSLLLQEQIPVVQLGGAGWEAEVVSTLAAVGAIRIRVATGGEAELRQALIGLIATPVNVDFLQFYPAVEQVRREGDGVVATLVVREVA
jgi:hypothetical protein